MPFKSFSLGDNYPWHIPTGKIPTLGVSSPFLLLFWIIKKKKKRQKAASDAESGKSWLYHKPLGDLSLGLALALLGETGTSHHVRSHNIRMRAPLFNQCEQTSLFTKQKQAHRHWKQTRLSKGEWQGKTNREFWMNRYTHYMKQINNKDQLFLHHRKLYSISSNNQQWKRIYIHIHMYLYLYTHVCSAVSNSLRPYGF